ncbi:cutinase family protein [Streptomyces longwoodensis]
MREGPPVRRSPIWLASALSALLVLLTGTSVSPVRADAQQASASARCSDVLFVGARGSGEKGPGTPGWGPVSSDPYGLGPRVYGAYARFFQNLAGHRTVDIESVNYAANSVSTLFSRPATYFANISRGVTWTLDRLNKKAAACPNQQIVLGGYSQGAMVMHRVLHQLSPATLSRVSAAVLIADGDEIPNDQQTRYGSASPAARGAGHLYRTASHTSTAKFASTLRKRVLSVCNRHDPVCDLTSVDVALYRIHLGYVKTRPVLDAADQAARAVRALPLPTPATVTLQADTGKPVTYKLTADVAFGYTLQWGLLPSSTLPAGLTLSSSGVIQGTPTTSGTYATQARVRAVSNGTAGPWVNLRITTTVKLRDAGTWTATETVMPSDAGPYSGQLTDIACPTTALCVGIGSYGDSAGNLNAILTWGPQGQPSAWTSTPPPLPADASVPAYPELDSVTCWSETLCVAVGAYSTATDPNQGLILTWSGSSWTAVRAPLPARATSDPTSQAGGRLVSVACRSASTCVAVGGYGFTDQSSQHGAYGLIVEGKGESWTATEAPMVTPDRQGATDKLTGVACGGGSCIAIGDDTSQEGPEIVHSEGGAWSTSSVTMPVGNTPYFQQPRFNGVSCASSGICQAIGSYLYRTPDGHGLIEGLTVAGSGSTWTGTQVPLPDNVGSFRGEAVLAAESLDVDCLPAACVSVGGYGTNAIGPGYSIVFQGFLLTGQSVIQTPLPPGSSAALGGNLNHVDCPTTTLCVATGGFTDKITIDGQTKTSTHAMVSVGFGSNWVAQDSPLPAGAAADKPYPGLWGVSCPTSTACTAIGVYRDENNVQRSYILTGRL